MVWMISLVTGFVAAMLRSLFAVIIVAFLVTACFLIAYIAYGTPVFLFLMTLIGFNAGLILYVLGCAFLSKARSVH